MKTNTRGLLVHIFNPHDFVNDPDDAFGGKLDQHDRFFTVEMGEMPVSQLVRMQFRQGMAPQTVVTILRQTITLVEALGRELLNQPPLPGYGHLNSEGDIIWNENSYQVDLDEILDHLPPESDCDMDWLEDPLDCDDIFEDLDDPLDDEDSP